MHFPFCAIPKSWKKPKGHHGLGRSAGCTLAVTDYHCHANAQDIFVCKSQPSLYFMSFFKPPEAQAT